MGYTYDLRTSIDEEWQLDANGLLVPDPKRGDKTFY